ncbi:F-box/LRR-repeat protein 4 isoform X2 [Anthonomus grandis grandis]|uniref:F-box/LRR-repeat protein 4 isoform X2 n=1 Tax=Anthonomus grandis grandis TaxID=2921223 RepID=UPI00216574BF|nr:F-box/LRR-repeat protein 4 isoform X2 [Anthonomus grandis grandis]
MSSRETNIIPIEEVFKMRYLEQYVQTVVNYSSRYNNQCSYSYAPINLVGKYVKYPCYGDFPETYFLRSYGKWWKTSKASQKEYRPQDFDLLAAEDYVTLEFGSVVIPREIFIYEVYNPGAIVRIWGRLKTTPNWVLLWEGFPQKCAPRSRKFSPPLRKLNVLIKCAQVNTRLNKLCQNQALYQNISLKIYWYLVDSKALEFFKKKIGNIKKLDLSWCNETQLSFNRRLHFDYYSKLQSILESSSQTITHLCLNNNYFVDDELLHRIAACTELKDLRLHHTFNWIRSPLDKLGHLVTLDLSLTNIIDQDLIQILISNPHLEHLVLDLCEKLVLIDSIVETVTLCNKKLKTWSSWKAYSFTSAGIRKFGSCENLEELDLGWCLMCRDPGDCLAAIANGCKKLRRLILSEWRGVTDQLLMPIIHSCKELTQIDLIGIKGITAESCEKALFLLPKLRLLDVSFCDSLRQHEVEIWREQYPHITIQRSHSDYS